mgnify:CR=1 FL=1
MAERQRCAKWDSSFDRLRSDPTPFGVFGHEIEAEDQTVALFKFKNGALGTVYTTTCCYPGLDQLITIYGQNGSVLKDASRLLSWKIQGENEKEEEEEEAQSAEQNEPDELSEDELERMLDGMQPAVPLRGPDTPSVH